MQRLEFSGAVLPIYGSVGVKRLTRMESMYLSNTTSFVGRGMQIIYYIRYNYMFRSLTMAIFKVYMKYLVSSYTKFIMCSGCGRCGGHEISYVFGGWEVWVHGDAQHPMYPYLHNTYEISCTTHLPPPTIYNT